MTSNSQEKVHDDPGAQTGYKLAILRRYLPPLVSKLAAARHPILLVDGFAGTGGAGEGLGSTGLMIRQAEPKHASVPVRVRAVEPDPAHFAKLQETASKARKRGCDVWVKQSAIVDALPEVVQRADGHTLFMFLDPYNLSTQVLFSLLADLLKQHRHRRYPPTELLANMSSPGLFRNPDPGRPVRRGRRAHQGAAKGHTRAR